MSTLTPTTSSVIMNMTAAEMSIAERAAGLSIATLEDAEYPKVPLLSALAWVIAKRSDPQLSFKAYSESHTLSQITEQLGISAAEAADDAAGDAEPAGKASKTTKPASSRASASRQA